jgi:hypothetical protein
MIRIEPRRARPIAEAPTVAHRVRVRQPCFHITIAHIRLVTDHVISPTNVRSISESSAAHRSVGSSSSRNVTRQRSADAQSISAVITTSSSSASGGDCSARGKWCVATGRAMAAGWGLRARSWQGSQTLDY